MGKFKETVDQPRWERKTTSNLLPVNVHPKKKRYEKRDSNELKHLSVLLGTNVKEAWRALEAQTGCLSTGHLGIGQIKKSLIFCKCESICKLGIGSKVMTQALSFALL